MRTFCRLLPVVSLAVSCSGANDAHPLVDSESGGATSITGVPPAQGGSSPAGGKTSGDSASRGAGAPVIGGTGSTGTSPPGLATAVAAGSLHTCALLSVGTVRCWGDNTVGELGDGTTVSTRIPTTAIGVTGAIAMVAGDYSSAAVLADRSIRTWGYHLADVIASPTAQLTPLPITGVTSATEVTVGKSLSGLRRAA